MENHKLGGNAYLSETRTTA